MANDAKTLIQQVILNRGRAVAIARSTAIVTDETKQSIHQTTIVEVSPDGGYSRSSSSSSISSM